MNPPNITASPPKETRKERDRDCIPTPKTII